MKTTLDLPEDLLIEAKTVAAQRRTTLKAIVENALRRELRATPAADNPDPERFEIGPLGLLVLKRRPGDAAMTLEEIDRLRETDAHAEFHRAVHPVRP
jgi:hypothetical protein